MNLVRIIGTVLDVQDAPNGTFFFIQTSTGGFQKLYNHLRKFEFVKVGTKGTFYVDGLPTLNPRRGNWEAIPRIVNFIEGNPHEEDHLEDDVSLKRTHEDINKPRKNGGKDDGFS